MKEFEEEDKGKGTCSIWKNSRISDKDFCEVFQAQHISKVRIEIYLKNTISLSTPWRRQY